MGGTAKEGKKKIKVVAFDWGRTLGSNSDDWDGYFPAVGEVTGLAAEKLGDILERHWPKMKVGGEDEDKFWEDVVKASKKKLTVEQAKRAYRKGFWYDPEMKELVERVKTWGVRVVILSNDVREWMAGKREEFKLDEQFEKVYCSADVGLAKPGRKIYEYVLDDLGIEAGELLFIDNQKENCEGARELGIEVIWFRSARELARRLEMMYDRFNA